MTELNRLIYQQVGEGELTFAEVLFSFPDSVLSKLDSPETIYTTSGDSYQIQLVSDGDWNELELFWKARDAVLGDVFNVVRRLEVRLHDYVKRILEAAYDRHDDGWWIDGVPGPIRVRCASTRELDPGRYDLYAYTTLIDLKSIIDTNWKHFMRHLPEDLQKDKRRFLGALDNLNRIRNRVMHPTKSAAFSRNEYNFLRDFESQTASLGRRE